MRSALMRLSKRAVGFPPDFLSKHIRRELLIKFVLYCQYLYCTYRALEACILARFDRGINAESHVLVCQMYSSLIQINNWHCIEIT